MVTPTDNKFCYLHVSQCRTGSVSDMRPDGLKFKLGYPMFDTRIGRHFELWMDKGMS
jgi:hypothetical protein